MTIDELIAATGLTANDEIPIWDAEATGEPTKKITAQQLAAAIVALANLVTSVNGETGAVTLTAEDVNAKAVQTPVTDPTASGNAVAFIDSISQNAQGVIVPTKKTVPNASTMAPGLMSAADKVKLDGISGEMADKASAIVDTASGAIASFPDGMAAPAKDVTIGIEPVQSGSGDPSPTNVRPISGWTGANVTRTGFNVWDEETEIGDIDGITGAIKIGNYLITKNYIPVLPNTTYYFSMPSKVFFYEYDANKDVIMNGDYAYHFKATSGTFTTGANTHYITFRNDINNASQTYNHDICINLSDPAKNGTYEPGHVVTIPISWQSVAGTVYGGTLDVTTGLLTVDRGIKVLNGSEDWAEYASGNGFRLLLSEMKNGEAQDGIANYLPTVDGLSALGIEFGRNDKRIYLAQALTIGGVSNLSSWRSYLESNQLQIVFPLATPQTYQLTPVKIEMLLGDNNVWADTGDSTVTYRADTKLYIQKINAPTDDDMIADAQIASGRYFIVGGNLYRSTTTIPAGDAINPGSNCILTNLADALNALNT